MYVAGSSIITALGRFNDDKAIGNLNMTELMVVEGLFINVRDICVSRIFAHTPQIFGHGVGALIIHDNNKCNVQKLLY